MISALNVIGVLGVCLLSYSNIPQLILFTKQKHAEGISASGTWLGGLGLVLRFIYVYSAVGNNFIILFPYTFSVSSVLITLYYIYFPSVQK